jgi:hypothetical protein
VSVTDGLAVPLAGVKFGFFENQFKSMLGIKLAEWTQQNKLCFTAFYSHVS